MLKQGLSVKTVEKHILNVEVYINDYLLHYAPLNMKKGCGCLIDEYFSDFFVRKCMWSTPASIKSTASSIKKFYKCMLDNKVVSEKAYKELCTMIKESMEEWQDGCDI